MLVTKSLNRNYLTARNWSNRNKSGKNYYQLVNRIRNFLNLLSGNNVVDMLNCVLAKQDLANLSQKYTNALSGIAVHVNKRTKLKQRHYFIRPLRQANLTLKEIKEIGFKCGKSLWKTCLNKSERLEGGRPEIPETIKDGINNHMENVSSEAANRLIKERIVGPNLPNLGIYDGNIRSDIEKRLISVRNRFHTIRESKKLYDDIYEQVNGKKISYSTFLKYIQKKYKKPKGLSDLCN
jgi:hypothetical protein